MRELMSLTKVDLRDGTYEGRWSAYWLKILDEKVDHLPLVLQKVLAEIKTINGVRGINCKVMVEVKDGEVFKI
jgi:hypothetical protein